MCAPTTIFVATYSFDVDLEAIKGVFGACLYAFFVERNTLLLEEGLHGRLSNFTVISQSVGLNAASHRTHIVMGTVDLVFWELSYSLNQVLIFAIKNDNTSWENAIILDMLVKAWLFALWKFLFFIFNRLTIFTVLNHFL